MKLAPIVDELAVEFDGRVKVVKAKTADAFEAAGAYGVRMLPTVILFKQGVPTQQLTKLRSKADLMEELESSI